MCALNWHRLFYLFGICWLTHAVLNISDWLTSSNSWQMLFIGIQLSMTDKAMTNFLICAIQCFVTVSVLDKVLEQCKVTFLTMSHYLKIIILKSHHRFSGCPADHREVVWSSPCPCTGRKEPWWQSGHWSAPDRGHGLAHGLQPRTGHCLKGEEENGCEKANIFYLAYSFTLRRTTWAWVCVVLIGLQKSNYFKDKTNRFNRNMLNKCVFIAAKQYKMDVCSVTPRWLIHAIQNHLMLREDRAIAVLVIPFKLH